MQEALNQKIDAFIAANKEQILKDIATLVSINSVEGAPSSGVPSTLLTATRAAISFSSCSLFCAIYASIF